MMRVCTAVVREEEVLGNVVALEAVQEGKEHRVVDVRERVLRVQLGVLRGAEGVDGRVRRGARLEYLQAREEVCAVVEPVHGIHVSIPRTRIRSRRAGHRAGR